jgi:hypothetical protein
MATLYVTEFSRIERQDGLPGAIVQIAQQPPVAEQTVSISGTSAQSSAFNANTRFVRLHTDAICSVEFGTNPTATTAKARLAANQTEYFAVNPGGSVIVAVITNT